jgi:hypothetical protein
LPGFDFRRNFAPNQSYAVLDLPSEMWAGTCYFGASGLALERLMRAHDYSLVAFDQAGFNLFFVRTDLLGLPLPHSFAALTSDPRLMTWGPNHKACQQQVWLRVEEGPDLAGAHWLRHMPPAVLAHRDDPNLGRTMYEVETHDVLTVHRPRHHAGAGWPGASDGDAVLTGVRRTVDGHVGPRK